MPVIPHAPMRPRALQVFERGHDLVDVLAPRRRELRAVLVAVRVDEVVGADVAVQEEHVDPVEPHRGQARVERRLERGRDRPRAPARPSWHFVVIAHARGQRAAERGADDRFARAVHRRGVDEVDARVDRGVQRRDRLVLGASRPTPARARRRPT